MDAASPSGLADLEPPARLLASDNGAPAHPAVIEAVASANSGHALAYGEDRHTARCEEAFRELFEADVETRLVFNGTGANIAAFASMMGSLTGPHHAIVCSNWSHANSDETGAPERILATKLIDLPCPDAKLTPNQLRGLAHLQGNPHHAQPGIVTITQPTELGTLYAPSEIAALSAQAHEMGLLLHLDGARIANATAALGGSRAALRSFTTEAGVDVVSFGGTKNGLLGTEAVVFLNPALAHGSEYVRKQVAQLPSKMRFLAAQFTAVLEDDLWIALGSQANSRAQQLHGLVDGIADIDAGPPPAVNSLYPRLPGEMIRPLQEWSFFWDWDVSRNQVRWMTSWDTTREDLEAFVAGVRVLAG